MVMPEENHEHNSPSAAGIGYRKGCPMCEHSDPELERELQAFAQLLFDLYLEQHGQKAAPESDVDNGSRSPTLRERSKPNSITQ